MIRSAFFLIIILFMAEFAFAQFGPPSTATQGTQAAQLPVSARNQQTGAVTAVQSPVPGTTTSVNTTNPSVQVQGPYAGSNASTARPFDGRLALREAIERGLEYNLGTVGLNEILRQARGQDRVVRSSVLPNIVGTVTS